MIMVPDELKKELVNPRTADTTRLAYIGDAVYEVYIRMKSCEECGTKPQNMNRFSVHYVKADSQAIAAKALMADFAGEEELSLMKRARNRTNTSRPRGSTPSAYKLATGFEALIGWLYIKGDTERLTEAVAAAIKAIDDSTENKKSINK